MAAPVADMGGVDVSGDEEVRRNGLEGVDDDAEYLRTHTHPRAHPHEEEPEGTVARCVRRLIRTTNRRVFGDQPDTHTLINLSLFPNRALYVLEGGDPDSEVDVIHEAPNAKVR